MWLTDARVVDVVRGQIRRGVSVEMSGGRVGAIRKHPDAGERMSLGARYLVPGLISVHTHPQMALAGATSNAARLLGLESQIGTVEQGKVADLVALDENPLLDLSAMRGVSLVIQSGRAVRCDRSAS